MRLSRWPAGAGLLYGLPLAAFTPVTTAGETLGSAIRAGLVHAPDAALSDAVRAQGEARYERAGSLLAGDPALLPRPHLIYRATREVAVPAASGILITLIIIVFLPLLTLLTLFVLPILYRRFGVAAARAWSGPVPAGGDRIPLPGTCRGRQAAGSRGDPPGSPASRGSGTRLGEFHDARRAGGGPSAARQVPAAPGARPADALLEARRRGQRQPLLADAMRAAGITCVRKFSGIHFNYMFLYLFNGITLPGGGCPGRCAGVRKPALKPATPAIY